MTKASQKFLTTSFPGEYTPEEMAEIDTTRKVLFEAERLLHWHNMEWKKMLGIASAKYTLDPPVAALAGYQRVQKAKHERRLAKRAVKIAAVEYRRAVNEPIHTRRSLAARAMLRDSATMIRDELSRMTSHTAFATVTKVLADATHARFEGVLESGDRAVETVTYGPGGAVERRIVITRPGKE